MFFFLKMTGGPRIVLVNPDLAEVQFRFFLAIVLASLLSFSLFLSHEAWVVDFGAKNLEEFGGDLGEKKTGKKFK